ncbi:hypothetical protein MAM1_0042d02976 [Mucor ambiguus]|uniref:Uncharacterized protein n=1 Tax=Mucor ambiguus TaxID=91626 RepID=A0A0C9M3G0_9FUNG|nr:hypothetical protein MAM1_0042d02976 [Mucor ambiguus]
MTQSPSLRFFSSFKGGAGAGASSKQQPKVPVEQEATNQPDNVQGWLMNVESYHREPQHVATIVDADNNSIPIEHIRNNRSGRPGSIASEDSVNLDELINANFTVDMDDETDLPDLADLDLDDSNDDFWKLEKNDAISNLTTGYDDFSKSIADNIDLDWSPTDTDASHMRTSLPVTPSSDIASRYIRSDSISSENSLTSQSTITQYAKYGLTPVTYPSESSSTSSRSLSRQSNYSTASSNTTSGIPHPRTNSSSNNINPNASGGIPTPSRSYTLRDSNVAKSNASYILSPSNKKGSTQRTAPQLAKRASHIPAPASYTSSPPSPQRTISSSSSGLRMPKTPTATQKRIPQRSSHIPSVRESLHRPGSPLQHHQQQPHQRPSATPSRIGMRSPTPGGPRNSIFAAPNKEQQQKRSITPTTRHHHPQSTAAAAEDNKRPASAMTSRPSGLRPPGSVAAASSTNSARSVSRIGTYKKPTSS